MTRTFPLPDYVFRRGKGYAVRYSVPTEYQALIGKKQIVRGLGTQDLAQAIVKRDQVLKEIQNELRNGRVPETAPAAPKPKQAGEGSTVRDTAHRWLTQSDGIKASTRARYRQHLEAFERYSGNTPVAQIDRAMALGFIQHIQQSRSERTGEPLSQRSIQSYQSCLASYWRVLDHWGMVDADMRNPFSSLLRRVAGQRKKADPRAKELRPVSRKEAESLLRYIAGNHRLKYQSEMLVTVRLLWVTGCRLNEICGRSLSDIDDRGDHIRITIPEAKTDAGKRVVMIVGKDDCELLRSAVAKAKMSEPSCPDSRYLLFPRVQLGGYDKRPSHYLGKALEAARKALPEHRGEWDMHSFRRNAVSALVNAGVSREALNLAVGHSNRDDIGLDVYAKRADLSEVIRATFDALFAELGGSLNPD
ncbi:tyrosine-type recombinase/integrase [Psychromarinibacter sp. S121]|uniref:tyrosine-type recombinase/integrase n=1 Tax=Psychromarinibacter sp. S121 TaxID=3415127 RepID=UPI003C7D3395